jgi:hypothetical protein
LCISSVQSFLLQLYILSSGCVRPAGTKKKPNMTAFCDTAPCGSYKLTDVSEVLTVSIIALIMEAINISETLVNFYETTRRNIPERFIHTRRRKNVKT